jgi:hypothetical protein
MHQPNSRLRRILLCLAGGTTFLFGGCPLSDTQMTQILQSAIQTALNTAVTSTISSAVSSQGDSAQDGDGGG